MDGSVRSRHTVLLEHLATQQLRVEALLQRDRGEVRSQEDFSEVTWDCTHCFVIFLFFVLIGKYMSDCQWSEHIFMSFWRDPKRPKRQTFGIEAGELSEIDSELGTSDIF